MGINLASYVGATTVREMVIGYGDRAATPAELKRMQALVREAMRQGAVGCRAHSSTRRRRMRAPRS